MKKKHKVLKIVLLCVAGLLVTVLAFVGGFLIFATATTLQVKDQEDMKIKGAVETKVDKANELKLLTWNVGYGGLDERQDCYFDGGKGVDGESKEVVNENILAMKNKVPEIDPDIFYLQEVDVDSKRSYEVDELKSFQESFSENNYNNSYAPNFRAGFVPIPLYNPLGKVDAGIASFSKYKVSSATRIQLPIPFVWPVSLLNLKRCLLVNRSPNEGSDK